MYKLFPHTDYYMYFFALHFYPPVLLSSNTGAKCGTVFRTVLGFQSSNMLHEQTDITYDKFLLYRISQAEQVNSKCVSRDTTRQSFGSLNTYLARIVTTEISSRSHSILCFHATGFLTPHWQWQLLIYYLKTFECRTTTYVE